MEMIYSHTRKGWIIYNAYQNTTYLAGAHPFETRQKARLYLREQLPLREDRKPYKVVRCEIDIITRVKE